MKKLVTTIAIGMATVASMNADVIWTNPITGTNPNLDNPYTTGQTVTSNLTVSGIGRGTGINGTNATDRYAGTAFVVSGNEAGAISSSEYFTFTLDADSGYEIDFTSLSFVIQGSATGPHNIAVMTSVGGFAVGNEVFTFTQAGASAYTTGTLTVDLSGAAFQNLTAPIEIRIYGWGASNATGTLSVNSFTFDGAVVAVPEPTAALLIGCAGLTFSLVRRKRMIA